VAGPPKCPVFAGLLTGKRHVDIVEVAVLPAGRQVEIQSCPLRQNRITIIEFKIKSD